MEHVAVMRKSWGLLQKVLAGEKVIESRWYKCKSAPWGKIYAGDTVYFKNAGEPVSVKANVKDVLAFENLNPGKIRKILDKYGKEDGLQESELEKYFNLFKDKKYCLLIFLDKPEKIQPFNIDKTGFGTMAAWICIDEINKIRVRSL